MPGSCYDSETDDFCIAFLEEAHRSPSRSVAYLNGARLGQSLECGRREGEIAYCVERTPATPNVPVVASLASEGGLPSTSWAGPETIARSVRQGNYA